MSTLSHIRVSGRTLLVQMDLSSPVARRLLALLPIQSTANNIGGEIYFRVPEADIEYDGTQTEEFQKGDLVYWRSPTGERKYSIALFYGNTRFSNWRTPTASSPCVKVGSVVAGMDDLDTVQTGEAVHFGLE
ncbi:MAG: cyclophilin-like fold protein [Thermoanaerobaculaceae bacterium]|nr:cyclophilin-like fold protein [Thermoanaerobaculaceae bacterium]